MPLGLFDQVAWLTKKVKQLCCAIQNNNANYKVYTALLTQQGECSQITIYSDAPEPLVIGRTYQLGAVEPTADFTNVGAPNNNSGTYFVATGTTPNSWGTTPGDTEIYYNSGAPIVSTILENTLGYSPTWNCVNDGYYTTNEIFNRSKTYLSITNNSFNTDLRILGIGVVGSLDVVTVYTGDSYSIINNTIIQIKVYN